MTTPSPGILEPGHRGDAGDDGKGEPVDEADQDLAHDHATGVVRAEFAGRQRAHRHRHGLGRGIAALAGDDRRQHRQRHHLFELALEQAEHRGGQEGGGEIDQQPVEAAAWRWSRRCRTVPRRDVTPPSALRSSSASSSITSTTSSMVMTPTSRSSVSTTGAATRLYLPNSRATSSWSSMTRDAAAVLVDQVGQRHRPARAQQRVERHRALPVLGAVDDVDLVEPVGQIGRLAQVVDRLPDGPVRRHRDELGLHPPAGGIFRIIAGCARARRAPTAAASRGSRPGPPRRGPSSSSTASSDSSSRTPSATVSGSSSSRISSRTVSSTSLSAEKSKSAPVNSTRLTRSSGSSASIRSPRSASCSSATMARRNAASAA